MCEIVASNEVYMKLINAQNVNIGWERCKVVEGTDAMQCFKCKAFNHQCNGEYNGCNNDVLEKYKIVRGWIIC